MGTGHANFEIDVFNVYVVYMSLKVKKIKQIVGSTVLFFYRFLKCIFTKVATE